VTVPNVLAVVDLAAPLWFVAGWTAAVVINRRVLHVDPIDRKRGRGAE
jgi:hypothetical protein